MHDIRGNPQTAAAMPRDVFPSKRTVPSQQLIAVLARAAALLQSQRLGEAPTKRLAALRERLSGDYLQLAVLGQFKRGQLLETVANQRCLR